MSEEQPVDQEQERHIYLPPQPGHRRACLRFRNGLTQNLDMQPEELTAEIDAFLADPERAWLELRDAVYGEVYAVPKRVVEKEVLDVLVAWVQNPAPQQGSRGNGVVVAREMPDFPGFNQQQELERRRRRLN